MGVTGLGRYTDTLHVSLSMVSHTDWSKGDSYHTEGKEQHSFLPLLHTEVPGSTLYSLNEGVT